MFETKHIPYMSLGHHVPFDEEDQRELAAVLLQYRTKDNQVRWKGEVLLSLAYHLGWIEPYEDGKKYPSLTPLGVEVLAIVEAETPTTERLRHDYTWKVMYVRKVGSSLYVNEATKQVWVIHPLAEEEEFMATTLELKDKSDPIIEGALAMHSKMKGSQSR